MKYNEIELVPIVELKLLDKNKKYLFWRSEDKIIEELEGGCVFESEDGIAAVDYYGNLYDNVAEIPKPQKREMDSLEVMEYLHLLQLALNNCEKTFRFPIEIDKMFGGVVIYNPDKDVSKWSNYTELNGYDNLKKRVFAILKNGKVTEFELPQIEA